MQAPGTVDVAKAAFEWLQDSCNAFEKDLSCKIRATPSSSWFLFLQVWPLNQQPGAFPCKKFSQPFYVLCSIITTMR